MSMVLLGIGSNLEREHHIATGLDLLAEEFQLRRASSVYESEALGFEGPAFLNFTVELEVQVPVAELARYLRQLEFRIRVHFGHVRGWYGHASAGDIRRTAARGRRFCTGRASGNSRSLGPHWPRRKWQPRRVLRRCRGALAANVSLASDNSHLRVPQCRFGARDLVRISVCRGDSSWLGATCPR